LNTSFFGIAEKILMKRIFLELHKNQRHIVLDCIFDTDVANKMMIGNDEERYLASVGLSDSNKFLDLYAKWVECGEDDILFDMVTHEEED